MAHKMISLCAIILASVVSLGICVPSCSHEISNGYLSLRNFHSNEVVDNDGEPIFAPPILKHDVKTHLNNAVQSFSFVRRSLSPSPMASEQNRKLLVDMRNKHGVPLKTEGKAVAKEGTQPLLKRLKAAVIFRENIVFIFSYLLHGQKDALNEHQYASLQMIYDVLKKKRVYVYNMLSMIGTLRYADKNKQTQVILLSMKNNLPIHLHCAVTYLQDEIKSGKLNLNTLLKSTELEEYDYLDGLDMHATNMCGTDKCDDELEPYDEDSEITGDALGPVYVKIQKLLDMKKFPLTQQLFGLILVNLPNPADNPVLEENIKYVYDVTSNNLIKDWAIPDEHLLAEVQEKRNLQLKGVYKHIALTILTNLPNADLPWVFRNALVYILFHLKPVTVANVYPNTEQMYAVTKNGIRVFSLLTSIVTPEFSPDAKYLSDALINYLAKNLEKKYLDEVFDFNRFAYSDPFDLLLALLTRIKTRAPPTKIELLRPATALLSELIFKKEAKVFSPSITTAIDVPILLNILYTKHLSPNMPLLADSLLVELLRNPLTIIDMNEEIPISKESCRAPRQCLLKTISNIIKHHNIPQVVLDITEKISTSLYPEIDGDIYNNQTLSNTPLRPGEHDTDENNPLIRNVKKLISPDEVNSDQMTEVITRKPKRGHKGPSGSRSVSSSSDSAPSEIDSSAHASHDSGESRIPISVEKLSIGSGEEQTSDSEHLASVDNAEDNGSIEVHPHKRPKKHFYKQPGAQHGKRPVKQSTETPESVDRSDNLSAAKVKHTSEKPSEWPESEGPDSIDESEEFETHSETTPTSDEGTVILPPSIEPNKTIYLDVSENGVTVITTQNSGKSKSRDSLPSVTILLQEPDPGRPLHNLSPHIEKNILQPLKLIFGKKYIQKILGGPGRINQYPTNIALLRDLLEAATKNPKVIKNKSLLAAIKSHIINLDYIAVTVLLPVVVSSEKLTTDVVYSTIDLSNPSSATLGTIPISHNTAGAVTIPLMNPLRWLESVNSTNPYEGLIPDLPRGSPEEVKLRPLKYILTQKKMITLLGPKFNPQIYPTKGALLITTLRKLAEVQEVKSNPELNVLIEQYLKALELPSMYTKVPITLIMNTVAQPSGKWQPEMSSLLQALPPPANVKEFTMIKAVHDFLMMPNLLADLGVSTPSVVMTRGEFLKTIIGTALHSNKLVISDAKLKALKYYKNKIIETGPGALPVLWVWVRVYVLKTEVKLGNLIENTIPFDKLPYKHKLAYNELISYFSEHPELLHNNHNFQFEKYKTQGEFLKGLLKYLLKKRSVNKTAKKNIQILLPYVQLTGSGAVKIPTSIQTIEQQT